MESGVLGRIKNFALLRIKRFALRHRLSPDKLKYPHNLKKRQT